MTSRSHQGLVRINNEDCIHCDDDGQFIVLADGMGGLLAGEVASGVGVHVATEALLARGTEPTSPQVLEQVLRMAHDAVLAEANSLGYAGKMGTTMIIWANHPPPTHPHQAGPTASLFAHVGDSRLYSFAARELTQITNDHTVAQRMIDSGHIAPEDEHRAPNRHVLTQAMGLPGLFVGDCGLVPPAERLLICSDGLSDLVPATELAEIMTTDDLEDCANFLLKAALDKGGRDNVTLALVEF